MKPKLIFPISIIALFGIWAALAATEWIPSLFLPTPQAMVEAIGAMFQNGFAWDISISTFRVFVAFILSLALAIPAAFLIDRFQWAKLLLAPYIDWIRYLPVPTLIPLTILFFGLGEGAKIMLLFTGTFFQLVLLIVDDLKNVPHEFSEIAYTLHFSEWRRAKMKFKAILPQLYDNGRITLGWCWTYLVIAELVATDSGIGHVIKEAQRFSETPVVFVSIFTMGLIGFTSDNLLKSLYFKLFPYRK